jgi:hypothetical protein
MCVDIFTNNKVYQTANLYGYKVRNRVSNISVEYFECRGENKRNKKKKENWH